MLRAGQPGAGMFAEGQAVVLGVLLHKSAHVSATDPPRPRPHTTAAAANPSLEGIPKPSDSPPRRGQGWVSFCWRICEELYSGFFDDACPDGVKNLGRNFLKRPEFRGELRNPKFLQEGGEPEQIAG